MTVGQHPPTASQMAPKARTTSAPFSGGWDLMIRRWLRSQALTPWEGVIDITQASRGRGRFLRR